MLRNYHSKLWNLGFIAARTVHSVTSDTQLSLNLSRSTSGITSELGAGSPHSCDESTLRISPDSKQVGYY